MKSMKPITRGLLLLVICGLTGYLIGLGLDALVGGRLDFTSPLAGLFAMLGSATGFFTGLVGYRGITRGLVFQLIGTMAGALFVTGIRALLGLRAFSTFFLDRKSVV